MGRRDEITAEIRERFKDGVPVGRDRGTVLLTGRDAETAILDMIERAVASDAMLAAEAEAADELSTLLALCEQGRANPLQVQRALFLLSRSMFPGAIIG